MSHSSTRSGIPVPPEIALEIFYHFDSLSDAFVFASTCQQLQEIWLLNARTIYRKVTGRGIECERHIVRFLKVQTARPATVRKEMS